MRLIVLFFLFALTAATYAAETTFRASWQDPAAAGATSVRVDWRKGTNLIATDLPAVTVVSVDRTFTNLADGDLLKAEVYFINAGGSVMGSAQATVTIVVTPPQQPVVTLTQLP